jgi:hypothetical protein
MKRDNDKSCIESTLFQYKTDAYKAGAGTALPYEITSTYDFNNIKRKWKFILPGADLKNILITDESS